MDIASYQFQSDEIESLKRYRDEQQDVRLKIRFIALLMLAQGINVEIIASSVGKSVKTIENCYCHKIQLDLWISSSYVIKNCHVSLEIW